MLQAIAVIFGLGFLAAGIGGFVPSITSDGLLVGIFQVDTIHNIVHIASGVIALLASFSYRYSRLYFQIFGIIYGIVTILGFARGGDLSFVMMQFNQADNFLHLVIAIIALYLGFILRRKQAY